MLWCRSVWLYGGFTGFELRPVVLECVSKALGKLNAGPLPPAFKVIPNLLCVNVDVEIDVLCRMRLFARLNVNRKDFTAISAFQLIRFGDKKQPSTALRTWDTSVFVHAARSIEKRSQPVKRTNDDFTVTAQRAI